MLAWPRAIFFPASVAAAQPNKLKGNPVIHIQLHSIFDGALPGSDDLCPEGQADFAWSIPRDI